MRKLFFGDSLKAQAMLEYLVLSIFVAAIVFAALNFKQPGSVGDALAKQAQSYYKAGYQMISAGDRSGVSGGWCAWSACIDGFQERDCACPPPAPGRSCSGSSYKSCSN